MTVHIVIDNSGSMRDSGKTTLAASLFRIFHRHAPDGVEMAFYKWDRQIGKIDSPRDLSFTGTTDGQALTAFIDGVAPAPILLIGDGTVSRDTARALKGSGSVYLAVGCDHSPDELNRIMGESNVFLWADCITCFRTILSRSVVL